MKSITTLVLAFVAVLLCTPALAADPSTPEEIEADYRANVAYCKGRTWSDITEVQDLQFKSCLSRAMAVKVQLQMEVADAAMRSEFQAQLEAVQDELARVQAQLEAVQAPASASSAAATVPVSAGGLVQGASFRVVSDPSPVSIYNLALPGELKVKRLSRGAAEWAPGYDRVRVVVLNHGQRMPVAVDEPGKPSGFVEIYADIDHDGSPDPQAYTAVNPFTIQALYTGWKRSDDIQVWYLVPSGNFVEVTVNGQVVRLDVWVRAPRPGRGIAAYGGNTYGGARETEAHDGAKVW